MEIMFAQEKDSTMKTRNYIFYTSLAALLLLAAGCSNKEAVQAAKPIAAAPVRIATVASRTMPVELQAIGNVEAISTVTIKRKSPASLWACTSRKATS